MKIASILTFEQVLFFEGIIFLKLYCSLIHINLKDFMDPTDFYSQWRYRIRNMGVLLIDKSNQVIENPNGQFRFEITYPLIFNDTDSYKNVHTFSSRHFFCR